MNKKSILSDKQEEFINYLIRKRQDPNARIPAIGAISEELGISAACLREQMELAKNLGLIAIQPRKGIEILPYSFTPAVIKSLYYAVKIDKNYFTQFSDLRSHLEKSFFIEAVSLLSTSDIQELKALTQSAKNKLLSDPIQIPHSEHRKYHMLIYKQLNNIFLNGMLEAYWDTYEIVGLDVFTDLKYLEDVWNYHQRIIDNLTLEKFNIAYELLIEHMQLIYQR